VTLCEPNWYSVTGCQAYSLQQNVELNFYKMVMTHDQICTDKALADYRSANNWRLTIGRLIQKTYLGSDCYPRTLTYLKNCRVQTKQKCTQKQSYKTHPLLSKMEGILMFVYFW